MNIIELEKWKPSADDPRRREYDGQRNAQEVFEELKYRLESMGCLPDEYFLMGREWENGREIPREPHPVKRTEKKYKVFSPRGRYAVRWQPKIRVFTALLNIIILCLLYAVKFKSLLLHQQKPLYSLRVRRFLFFIGLYCAEKVTFPSRFIGIF